MVQASTTPPLAVGLGGTVAWSPDSSLFAHAISSTKPSATPRQVQIWSRVTGQVVTTLSDTDTFKGIVEGLAWSPNGQYLAEANRQPITKTSATTSIPGVQGALLAMTFSECIHIGTHLSHPRRQYGAF
jgi:WD40 repeat protein